ncbi:hypothetical protein [Cysteiniphilum halobium]|uniref:hypothetical protein n=1 Tax=Cysteiniphilum halobium TaxID=2219059 RepID=UPI003F850C39
MKKYITIISTALAVLTASSIYAADQLVTVNFTATVTKSTCVIDGTTPGSPINIDEKMGSLYLYNAGNVSPGVAVSPSDIAMEHPLQPITETITCASGAAAPTVSYGADGTDHMDSSDSTILILMDGVATTPLGIRLEDKNASTKTYLDFSKRRATPGVINTKSLGSDQYGINLVPELVYTNLATKSDVQKLWTNGATLLKATAFLNLRYS